VPLSRYTWSGAAGSVTQVMRRPQVVQPVPKPLPGFCQAAAALACTVRSFQPHWPVVVKVWFAWTETQYVPAVSTTGEPRLITKLGPFVKVWFGRDSSSVPGRLSEPFE
jgi:hypothetical protein